MSENVHLFNQISKFIFIYLYYFRLLNIPTFTIHYNNSSCIIILFILASDFFWRICGNNDTSCNCLTRVIRRVLIVKENFKFSYSHAEFNKLKGTNVFSLKYAQNYWNALKNTLNVTRQLIAVNWMITALLADDGLHFQDLYFRTCVR